ncbi:unnamed protein product [Sphagnum balticum]
MQVPISRDPPDFADLVFADSSTRLRYKRPLVLRTWYNAGLYLDERESSLLPRFWDVVCSGPGALARLCVCLFSLFYLRELVLAAVRLKELSLGFVALRDRFSDLVSDVRNLRILVRIRFSFMPLFSFARYFFCS